MINKERVKGIAIGVTLTTIIMGTSVFAQSYKKQLTAVYNDIKIEIDGSRVTPKDGNGKQVDPFTVDGTTYLPVRAVAQALGKNVRWDGSTKTVVINDDKEELSFENSLKANLPSGWHVKYNNQENEYELFSNKGLDITVKCYPSSEGIVNIANSRRINTLPAIDFKLGSNLYDMDPNTYSVAIDDNTRGTVFAKMGGDGTFETTIISGGKNCIAVFEVFENMWDDNYDFEYARKTLDSFSKLANKKVW